MGRSAAGPPVERRAPEPFRYSADQVLGRAPTRLRRRRDKVRLATHLAVATVLVALSVWWVVPLHGFAGPVLLRLPASHGVHAGDLPTLVFVAVALRSLAIAARTWAGAGRVAPSR